MRYSILMYFVSFHLENLVYQPYLIGTRNQVPNIPRLLPREACPTEWRRVWYLEKGLVSDTCRSLGPLFLTGLGNIGFDSLVEMSENSKLKHEQIKHNINRRVALCTLFQKAPNFIRFCCTKDPVDLNIPEYVLAKAWSASPWSSHSL